MSKQQMIRRTPSRWIRTLVWCTALTLALTAVWFAVGAKSTYAATSQDVPSLTVSPSDWSVQLRDDDGHDDDHGDHDKDRHDDDHRHNDDHRYDDNHRYDNDHRYDDSHRHDDSSRSDRDDSYRAPQQPARPDRNSRGWDDGLHSKVYGVVTSAPAGGRGVWTIGGGQYLADAYTRFSSHGMVMGVGMCAEVEYVPGNPPRAVKIEAKQPYECGLSRQQPAQPQPVQPQQPARPDRNSRSSQDDSARAKPAAPQSAAPQSAPAETAAQGPDVAMSDFAGRINYRPRSGVMGVWVIGGKPFFVGRESTVGSGVAALRVGDSVEVIFYTDEYGLNRAVWIGSVGR